MNTFTKILLLSVCASCNSQLTENTTEKEIAMTTKKQVVNLPKALDAPYVVNHKDYDLTFRIEKKDAQHATLVIDVAVKNDSWYVSPLDTKGYKGKFTLDFGEYKNIAFEGKIEANPPFNQIQKEFIDGLLIPNDAIKTNVTYHQELKINTTADFMVMGRVRFVIEPLCVMQEIPIMINYKYGYFEITEAKC